jgi:blocked-early-in-transport protein 1
MREKIGAFKSLAIDIGEEVREHNRLLKDTDDRFDNTQGMLNNAMGMVNKLAKSGNRYHMLYLFLFCLFVFVVLWAII